MTFQTCDSQSDGPCGQIVLFGDSITENAFDTQSGFSYGAALSHGEVYTATAL